MVTENISSCNNVGSDTQQKMVESSQRSSDFHIFTSPNSFNSEEFEDNNVVTSGEGKKITNSGTTKVSERFPEYW